VWIAIGAIALAAAGGLAIWTATRGKAPARPPATSQRYATELAGLVTAVATRNGLNLTVRARLVPGEPIADATPSAVLSYRRSVTGAAIAIGLTDQIAVDAWKAAGSAGQASLLQSWVGLVRGLLPAATVEVAVVGGAGVVARATLAAGATTVDVRLPTTTP
jgi:hypothetical protein